MLLSNLQKNIIPQKSFFLFKAYKTAYKFDKITFSKYSVTKKEQNSILKLY